MIEREFVKEILTRVKEKSPLMQFVIGPRQVGKTTGIEQLLKKYKKRQHYALVEGEFENSGSWLRLQWQTARDLGDGALLVIDEVQKIHDWAETLKSLWDTSLKNKEKIKCIFLGSSSLHLQKGLNESLAGRFEIIHVHHWDFNESLKIAPSLSLERFLEIGGYPKAYDYLKNPKRFKSYIKDSLVRNVIEKDILLNNNIKKPELFKQTIELLANYPAQEISYNKLLGQLQESGNVEIIKNYISIFESAFLVRSLQKYHAKATLTKASSPKILPTCGALVFALSLNPIEKGRLFEMAVGNELFGIVDQLYYWKEENYEVDFVALFDKKIFAIEVKSGRKKQSKSLSVFMEKFPKAIPIIIDPDQFLKLTSKKEAFFKNY
jgi:predicted AAA+ superfamily ATPase